MTSCRPCTRSWAPFFGCGFVLQTLTLTFSSSSPGLWLRLPPPGSLLHSRLLFPAPAQACRRGHCAPPGPPALARASPPPHPLSLFLSLSSRPTVAGPGLRWPGHAGALLLQVLRSRRSDHDHNLGHLSLQPSRRPAESRAERRASSPSANWGAGPSGRPQARRSPGLEWGVERFTGDPTCLDWDPLPPSSPCAGAFWKPKLPKRTFCSRQTHFELLP